MGSCDIFNLCALRYTERCSAGFAARLPPSKFISAWNPKKGGSKSSATPRAVRKSWAIKWLISDFRLRRELSRTILDFRLKERISCPLPYFLLIQNRQSKIRDEQRQRHRCVRLRHRRPHR